MIEIIQKNITTVEQGVIAHGVNCQGRMGSGVAKAIREKWPLVYNKYIGETASKSVDLLGTTQIVAIASSDQLYVANCYTQRFYGRTGRYASPDAIRMSVSRVYSFADSYQLDVFMPKIGCGLGGLDWDNEVYPLIKEIDEAHEADTFVCVL